MPNEPTHPDVIVKKLDTAWNILMERRKAGFRNDEFKAAYKAVSEAVKENDGGGHSGDE